ncbi:hypothetical protein ALP99_04915, partial [Pseudomonas syringae pv. tomato]
MQNQRLGLATQRKDKNTHHRKAADSIGLTFALWRLCAGDLRVCRGLSFCPVRQPSHSCHPFVWRRFVAALDKQKRVSYMQNIALRNTHTAYFDATLFLRHSRMLRAIFTDAQAWFCLADLARLMGKALDQRATLKLDADQRREVWLQANGECQRQLMISESGTLALLVHHYVPESRALRQWLTHEVLTVLHDQQNVILDNPRMT